MENDNIRKSIPKKLREKIAKRYNGRCGYCGCTLTRMQIDHIVPVIDGGTNDESNLMPSCPQCNNYKHSMSLDSFRFELGQQVFRLQKNVNFKLASKYNQVTVTETPIEFYFEKYIREDIGAMNGK